MLGTVLVWVEFKSGHGIWEELKSYRSGQLAAVGSVALSHSVFNFVAVDVAQFVLPISDQVAKIHRCFVVHSCGLRPFYSCCHARFVGQWKLWYLEGLRTLSSILAMLGTLQLRALRLSNVNPIDSMASKCNYYLESAYNLHAFIHLHKVTIVYLPLGFRTLSPLHVVAGMSEVLYWLCCSLQ